MTQDEIKEVVAYINKHYCVKDDWCAQTALKAIAEVRWLQVELKAACAEGMMAVKAAKEEEREQCAKIVDTSAAMARQSIGKAREEERERCAKAVKAAKEEEREQCAKVVEWYEADENCGDWRLTVESMAAAIRARQ